MSLTRRVPRTSGRKSFMTNHPHLMTCTGWKRSWNVNLEKFSQAKRKKKKKVLKKNRKRRKRSSSSFWCSAHSQRSSCPSEVEREHMLATFGDNSGEERQQTLNKYIKGALSSRLLHLSFVCFMCFTSFRTKPSSTAAAAAK